MDRVKKKDAGEPGLEKANADGEKSSRGLLYLKRQMRRQKKKRCVVDSGSKRYWVAGRGLKTNAKAGGKNALVVEILPGATRSRRGLMHSQFR